MPIEAREKSTKADCENIIFLLFFVGVGVGAGVLYDST